MTSRFSGYSALVAMTVSVLLPIGGAAAGGSEGLHLVDPASRFSQARRDYPDMDARYVRPATPISIAQIRQVMLGQSKQELEQTLGQPAFGHEDGSWEFHVSLPLTSNDRLVCQYRVYFDGEGLVTGAVWRRPQCADLVATRDG